MSKYQLRIFVESLIEQLKSKERQLIFDRSCSIQEDLGEVEENAHRRKEKLDRLLNNNIKGD